MADNKIEELFKQIVATTSVLQEALKSDNHEALAENMHDLLTGEVYVENGAPDKHTVAELENIYIKMTLSGYSTKELLEVMQLAILKSEKDDHTEVNKMMTPSAVTIITSLIIHELIKAINSDNLSIADPTIGTGNLLLQVMSNIKTADEVNLTGIGIDNDDSLLSLTDSYSQLLDINVDLYHQDSVALWPVSDIDLVVADLPIGYYPIEEDLERYETKAESGKSFAHHLLLENSMFHLKDSGFGVFVVPSEIFKTDQSKALAKWMTSNVYLQGVLSFPKDMFHSEAAQKSLVILQKHGDNAKQVEKVLMGEIPSLKDINLFKGFESEINNWVQSNFNKE